MSIPVGISYSGGKSSKWLIYAMLHGLLPRPEHVAVFFADTGEEHTWTYEDVAQVKIDCVQHGIEFVSCAAKVTLGDHLLSLRDSGATRSDSPSLFISDGRPGSSAARTHHKCTAYFKIAPMRRACSAWLKRIGKPKRIEKWIGFAMDEQVRATRALAKHSTKWERLEFPAIRHGRTRSMQADDLESWGVSVPKFSMCTFCPGKSIKRWVETPPEQRERVFMIDEAIRDLDQIGLTEGQAFLTRYAVSIRDLIADGDRQEILPGYETHCDGGHCFL